MKKLLKLLTLALVISAAPASQVRATQNASIVWLIGGTVLSIGSIGGAVALLKYKKLAGSGSETAFQFFTLGVSFSTGTILAMLSIFELASATEQ